MLGDIVAILNGKTIKQKCEEYATLVDEYDKIFESSRNTYELALGVIEGSISLPHELIMQMYEKFKHLHAWGDRLIMYNKNILSHLEILNFGAEGIARSYNDKTYSLCETDIVKLEDIQEDIETILCVLSDRYNIENKKESAIGEKCFESSEVGKC